MRSRLRAAFLRFVPDDLEHRTIATAAGRATYAVAGSGPPVVLLHGLDGSSRWWLPTFATLTAHFRCYALDFVIFDRWRERGRVALPRAGTFVAAWLDALGLDWSHIVAHSMGSYGACQLALERPERVGRLVLIAPAVAPPRPIGAREAVRLLPFFGALEPNFLPVLLTDSLRTGPLRWLRSASELGTARPLPVEHIRAPTLLIWGARDPVVPASNGPGLQRRIAGSRLLSLPGARHVPMYERPHDCNEAIARFLHGEEVGTP